jgi:phage-related protein
MAYDLRQWPESVYPGEVYEFPEALPDIDFALSTLRSHGPAPEGFNFKPLGKSKDGLWQINIRISASRRQIRILYAPYGKLIVVFHIHKKSSPQEQKRAYKLAMKRKKKAEVIMQSRGRVHVGLATIH